MAPLWWLASVLFTLATIVLLWPWLRTIPRLGLLPALPWQAGAVALLTIVALVEIHAESAPPEPLAGPPSAAASTAPANAVAAGADANTWADIANKMGAGGLAGGPAAKNSARPMDAAVASLQERLAKGGGSAADWELLARSYEFLGRPADAAKARAHQIVIDKVIR